ncbi:MAG: FAD-dependent oxidoreductase, partial [Candidatus Bipolaricaulota bacterium]
MSYDVAIIGAGSAGLFAALELTNTDLRVVIIEGGLPPKERTSITSGVGGAGTFSDGKLNLSSKIGGNPQAIGCSSTELDALIEQVDAEFTRCGAPAQYSGENAIDLAQLKQSAAQAGIEFIAGRQRHIGTVTIREVIDTLYHDLLDKGIEFRLETKVEDIATEDSGFRLDTSNGPVRARSVIAAPGRVGTYWLREQARGLGVGPAFGPLDIGVRVEFPAELYESIERVMYDAKLRVRTATYDDMVRTFCTNPRGFVVREDHEGFVLVNGHAENKRKSDNTNFALLVHMELTDPVEDTTEYGRAVAQLASTIGGGHPILQRLKDLQQGRRSTLDRIRRLPIRPTLE